MNNTVEHSNSLYLGDNLEILDKIPDNSIDLIYLDPPFNSKRDYNVIFKSESGIPIDQMKAFEDTWTYNTEIKSMVNEFMHNIQQGNYSKGIQQLMEVWIKALEQSDPEMLAYLVMMVQRLDKLYKKLNPTGSLYLHCDPTASHYIKVAMDGIFGRKNFVNEIVWCYKSGGASKNHWSRKHDIILMYAKNASSFYFTPQKEKSYNREFKRYNFKNVGEFKDEIGWYTEVYMKDYWNIDMVGRTSKERMGYPTQKPIKLLERIIKSSCPENGTVLDPFCGCGTTIEAAHKLGRNWIGIDVCKYAIDRIMKRLGKHGLERQKHYEVHNYPFVFDHIEKLLQQTNGRYIFQDWAIEHVGGISNRTKSGDRGVDGTLYFYTSMENKNIGKMIISVKSDKKLQASYIRDLIGTMNNQGAEMAGLISLAEPTEGMKLEAMNAGEIEIDMGNWGKHKFPRVQLLTVKNLFAKETFNTPSLHNFKQFG